MGSPLTLLKNGMLYKNTPGAKREWLVRVRKSPNCSERIMDQLDQESFSTSSGACASVTEQNIRLCSVCEDRGSGYHYSIYTCEGCKSFFKRYLANSNVTMECSFGGNCVINKYTRNKCQPCRLKKCIQSGMRCKEVCRTNNDKLFPSGTKRTHEDNKANHVTVNHMMDHMTDNTAMNKFRLPLQFDEFIQTLIDSDPFKIPVLDNQVTPIDSITTALPTTSETGNTKDVKLETIMSLAHQETYLIVKWARKVPGFQQLSFKTRTKLLQNSFNELSILRLTYRSMSAPEGHLMFSEDMILPLDTIVRAGLSESLNRFTLALVTKCKSLNVDKVEFALMSTLLLLYSDCPGLECVDLVKELQHVYLNKLKQYIDKEYSEQKMRYSKLLLRLPTIRSISIKAITDYKKVVDSGNLKMDELVAELLAKSEPNNLNSSNSGS